MPDKKETGRLSRRHFTRVVAKGVVAGVALTALAGQNVAAAANCKKERKPVVVKTYNLPGDRFFPESIGYDPATGYFFTGSLENGQLARGNVHSGLVDSYVAAGANGMNSAAGIKLDRQGHIFVAGGYSGKIFIYEEASARLLTTLQVSATTTVINDFVVLPQGEVYVTDSLNPYLYKISQDAQSHFSLDEHWLPLTGTPIKYVDGLNLNGITLSPDHRYLIVGQTNTGKLYRVEIANKEVREIDQGGLDVLHADGILLEGHLLYVARNAINTIATLRLSQNFLKAELVSNTTDPAFQFPTALAKAGHHLLIVNGQLDKEGPGGTPVLPFNIVEITLPEGQH